MAKHRGTWFALAVAGAALAVALRRLFPVRVEGPSMLPALQPGDFLAVSPNVSGLRVGQIVVVRAGEGFEIVKRVSGLAGDHAGGVRVAEGHVFVTGDNVESSTDSRVSGAVSIEKIVGIARVVYWPWRRVRVL